MAMDIKAILKAAGISETEMNGKSLNDQIKLITKKMKDNQEELELEQAKTYISNYDKLIPKVKSSLEQSVEIYVKSVGQKKTPTVVPVVGYNAATKDIIVFLNEKLYSVKEEDLIKSLDDLSTLINNKKPKSASKGTKKK
jgi:hypothetical protein